jgi:aspartate/methionine/tyrosine aminotransferase
VNSAAGGALSKRAEALLAGSRLEEYLVEHSNRLDDLWDAESNAGGYIPMAVAENKLVWDLLEPKFADCRELRHSAVGYDDFRGSEHFRRRLARFLRRTFLGDEVDADRIAVVNGAGSALELLFFALCDPGDGVLVPTPSYQGFWMDLETRDEVVIVPVHTRAADGFELTPDLLDEAIAGAGRPVKALLYTNPNNPIGRVDPPEKVDELLTWGEGRGVHVVADEIYALSIFDGSEFVSGAELRPEMSDWLHIVWAFSKDFAVSGLRSGVIYTHNETLHRVIDDLAYWLGTSGDTQSLLAQLIDDDEWVDAFLDESRRRLGVAYREVSGVFEAHGIPHVRGGAGFFFLLDVREFLPEETWEAERALWKRLLDEAKVNLTPGSACHNAEPGFLRVVFSAMPLEASRRGAERVARIITGG